MKQLFAAVAVVLAGCASPEYVAQQGNFDVCRLSMGGPHAQAADAEARARGLDCSQYYGAILGRQANENAVIAPLLYPQRQPQQVCTSQRVGDTVRTVCR